MPLTSRPVFTLNLPDGRALTLGDRTLVMGILNITPDSFADGGQHFEAARAVDAGLRMVDEGADLLDVGGESTRPGAEPVPAAEELRRVLPVIEALVGRTRVPVSVDTYKAEVAEAAFSAGASIVNDVSALLYDPRLGEVAAARGMPLVLMHLRGRPTEMYAQATYSDPPREVAAELSERIGVALARGVPRGQIVLDPGLGFAKQAAHSYATLAHLDALAALGCPILVGASRKSFLKEGVGEVPPTERDWGTAAAVTAAILLGAHIVRVHSVRPMVDVARVADRIRGS